MRLQSHQSRNQQEEAELEQWLCQPCLSERLPIRMSQIALRFADATAWQLESRQTHGTCAACNFKDDDLLFGAPIALDDPANVRCLPPAPLLSRVRLLAGSARQKRVGEIGLAWATRTMTRRNSRSASFWILCHRHPVPLAPFGGQRHARRPSS